MSIFWGVKKEGRKTKKQANVQPKLLIGQGKPRKTFSEASDG